MLESSVKRRKKKALNFWYFYLRNLPKMLIFIFI